MCFSKIFLSENRNCLICPDNCKSCKINENNQINCLECNSEFIMNKDGICEKCPKGCSSCYLKENNEIACEICYENYTLNQNEECILCSDIHEIGGEGCEKCGFNFQTSKYECYKCKKLKRQNSNYLIDSFTFVNNTFQCFNNSDPNLLPFYRCLIANYNSSNKKYECLVCEEYLIIVKNEGICKSQYEMGLTYCYEAENIGSENNPKYSCTKCDPDTAKITTSQNIVNCYPRRNNLSYCLEGIEEKNSNYICTKCIPNSHLIQSNICICDFDSFGKYNKWCYKCDDNENGIPGCNATFGCSDYYYSNDQLNCNQCKKGFFNYTDGQCFSCSYEIEKCEECHFDIINQKLICDKCPEEYFYNSKEKKCELRNCEEYPEICEGCIICEGNHEEYKSKKICQICKAGYFKTKENKCVYCRSEKYGGPECYKCKYDIDQNGKETDNIKCEYCPNIDYTLSSDGKCYLCRKYLDYCKKCEFIKNDDNIEKLVCILCQSGFYPNSEGKCVSYNSYIKKIPYCNSYNYSSIDNLLKNQNFTFSEIDYKIEAECISCKMDAHFDSDGNCVPFKNENCTLINIIQNYTKNFNYCNRFCSYSTSMVYIDFIYKNHSLININNSEENNTLIRLDIINFLDFNKLQSNYSKLIHNVVFNLEPSSLENKLCFKRDLDSEDYQDCRTAKYIKEKNIYICTSCRYSNYYIDNKTNACRPKSKNENEPKKIDDIYNCDIENIGTDLNPKYSCSKCKNDNYLLVTAEDDIKYCAYKDEELKYCEVAISNTSYINSKYNCTLCSVNFISYYSEFFERIICQNIFDKIITEKNISLEKFENIESILAKNGVCERKNFFTPDGKNCYACNNEEVGMPGCKGACSFSLKRNNILKCEECEKGYIETSEGLCQPCDSINQGCYECHYELGYPSNYLGIKRKRRFVCDYCEEGYIKSDEKCLTCKDLNLNNCEKCEIDSKNNTKYICTKCEEKYLLKNGNCEDCRGYEKIIVNNECISCDNTSFGGLNHCQYCEKNGKKLICQRCWNNEYVLKSNNTCLDENHELFNSLKFCQKVSIDNNNKIYCSKCDETQTLLKENNKEICKYIPILYDHNASSYIWDYEYYFQNYYLQLYGYQFNNKLGKYVQSSYYYDDDYYYFNNENYKNYPCEEAINLGTEDEPIYSCTKCFNIFEYEKLKRVYYIRIINERNNVSICYYQSKINFYNCTEAINKTKNGIIKYDCLKCSKDNKLVYNIEADIHYCQYIHITTKCMVKYCMVCQNNNNYFCSECLLSNYEVNRLTGSCVEKTEIIPSITFKDIFRLQMNSNKIINGQIIYGPSLRLRGITTSQINTRHAFLVYLTFKIKAGRNIRNLLEEKRIKAICEILKAAEEIINDTNIVEYECIGNKTENDDLNEYELNNIDEGNNTGLLKKSNLKELSNIINSSDLLNKTDSDFRLENLSEIITFEINDLQNQTLMNYSLDFKINGTINKKINPIEIKTKLEFNEIEEKVDCNFIIEENQTANLNCTIRLDKYKEKKSFSFTTSEILEDNIDIYLSKINEILFINKYEEEKKDKKKEINYLIIIIICIVSLIIYIISYIIIYYLVKKKSKNTKDEIKVIKDDIKLEEDQPKTSDRMSKPYPQINIIYRKK